MWPIPQPDLDARSVYATCVSKTRPAKVKARLELLEDAVAAAADEYEKAAATGSLHALKHLKDQPDGNDPAKGDNKKLTSCYTSRMARKGSAGREIYNQLIKSARRGRCPLCGHGFADTIDHQLPKIAYPLLAVTPANLVPACLPCNKAKGEAIPALAEEQTLHPYFDDVSGQVWLAARLTPPPEPGVIFFVAPPADWSATLSARVQRHFTTYKLARLYAAQVGTELAALSDYLRGKPYRAAIDEIHDRAASYGNRNSWQAALYRALAANPWFIKTGCLSAWEE
ncbi:HNH endonuclease [Streptacidiphilus albus]|uniref:HNH endonuclease n=1 Tax=Streptacidiphilus albus TaxID=105425 RepID=UPI00054B0968|nr:HNH endonuclease signature motif containing protein [Streptacidiphilus albus]